MSGETSSYDQQAELKKTPNIKVDINDLLSRVRDEKKKERKENLLFGLPKLDTNTIEKDITLKTVRDINKSNEERFIRMLTRILNTIVFN